MWAPNVILLAPALLLISRMARQVSTSRGSGRERLFSRVVSTLWGGWRRQEEIP
jgi:hypothetical protein